jgi:hypothetical protein
MRGHAEPLKLVYYDIICSKNIFSTTFTCVQRIWEAIISSAQFPPIQDSMEQVLIIITSMLGIGTFVEN